MRRTLAIAACILVGALTTVPAHAAGRTSTTTSSSNQSTTSVNWNQRDTAVYVVSTLNTLHTRKGRPIAGLLRHRFSVSKYEVWADASNSSLYFIELKTDSGQMAAGLAYQMGWAQPRGLSGALQHIGVVPAPDAVVQAFRNDQKTLIGQFSSTMPS